MITNEKIKNHSDKKTECKEIHRRTSFFEDIMLFFLVTFAFAAAQFENHFPQNILEMYRDSVFIIFAATILYTSFKNGIVKRIGFAVFIPLFWIIPKMFILLTDNGPEAIRFSLTAYVFSEFFRVLIMTPADIVGSFVGAGANVGLVLIVILCLSAYFVGMALSSRYVFNKFSR